MDAIIRLPVWLPGYWIMGLLGYWVDR